MSTHETITGLVYGIAICIGIGGVVALNVATNAAGRFVDALLANIEKAIKNHER